jgi:hypothetical protein
MSDIGGYNVPSRANHITLTRSRVRAPMDNTFELSTLDFQQSSDFSAIASKAPSGDSLDDTLTPLAQV